MGERKLWQGWAIAVKPRRGGEWSYPAWAWPTRTRAITMFNKEQGDYEARRKSGTARCVRVALVTMVSP